MKRLAVALCLVIVMAAVLWLAVRPHGLPATALPQHTADISNGQRMFHTGGCASCHASPDDEENTGLLGGGLAMDTAFGVFRVPNISPDPANGIGGWSALDFVNAMKAGVSPEGLHYYPAFPYASYTRMSMEDLIDLKSYLDTLPAVKTQNHNHELKFPWNIRWGIGFWKRLNLDHEYVVAGLPADPVILRGRYLAEGAGHCGECHTPRDWTGGLDKSRWLAGAVNPEGEGRIPNITPHEKGLGGWSEGDIAYYLQSGFTPDFDTVGGSMVEVQENLAHLPVEDLEAIAAYLKAVAPLQ